MNRSLATESRWTYDRACTELEESLLPIEIWDGQLIMSPTPVFFHQVVVSRIEEALRRWVRRHRLGIVITAPMDVVLEPSLVVQPDVLFISKLRLDIIKAHIHGAPDLVVEVASPNRRRSDYKDKKQKYESHGVREYWIADPGAKQIEVWSLQARRFVLLGRFTAKQHAVSGLLPGFKVRTDRIFAEPLKI